MHPDACETKYNLDATPQIDQTARAFVQPQSLISVVSLARRHRGCSTVKRARITAAAINGRKLGDELLSAGYKATADNNAVQDHKITTARRGPCPRAIKR